MSRIVFLHVVLGLVVFLLAVREEGLDFWRRRDYNTRRLADEAGNGPVIPTP